MILYQNDVVPQELLDFLQVKHFHPTSKNCSSDENQSDYCREQEYRYQSFHQRVVGFSADPYQLESRSDLPDIVVAGVLQGFYPKDVKVSFKKSCGKPSGVTCAPALPAHPKIPIITINRSSVSSLPVWALPDNLVSFKCAFTWLYSIDWILLMLILQPFRCFSCLKIAPFIIFSTKELLNPVQYNCNHTSSYS